MAAPEYDLSSRAFAADPYPVYRQLLEHAPVFHSQESGLWYVCRHADVVRLLRDPGVSADYSARLTARLDEESRTGTKRLLELFSRMTLYRDPPAQAILHRAIRRSVGPDLVSALHPRIRSITRRLLDDVQASGTIEVMRDLAFPLPAIVIAELLGAPETDLSLFRRWAHDIASFLGVRTDAAAARHMQRTLDEAADYFRALLRRVASDTSTHRQPWRGIFLRELASARVRHPELNEDDVIACCVMLVFAGHETTTGLIGNAIWCLLRHPEQLDALREAPRLVAAAIDEALRYEPPVHRIGRTGREAMDVAGLRIPAGAPLVMLLAAANRDPRVFEAPDRFDVRRERRPHLGFGAGGHQCPGSSLALVEARHAVEAVVRRFSDLIALAEPAWEYNLALRRPAALPVRFVPSKATPAA